MLSKAVKTSDEAFDTASPGPPPPSKEDELQDVLDRIGHQVDPAMKLQAVHDFKQLALAFSAEAKADSAMSAKQSGKSKGAPRRQSVGPGASAFRFEEDFSDFSTKEQSGNGE